MLGVIDHPSITNPDFTTAMISWWDDGLHFFANPPASSTFESVTILDTYYFSYFLVFFCGWFIMRRWSKSGSLQVKEKNILDLGLYTLLGVMIGAKVAYVLFYNLEFYLKNPSQILLNWSGMASHGAFVGVLLAIWLFTRRFKVSFLNVCDHTVFVAVLGPVFIRMANFLNGELYGRSAPDDLKWAMRFPMKDGSGRTLLAKLERQPNGQLEVAASDAGKVGSTLYALVRVENGAQLKVADQYAVPVPAHHAWQVLDDSSPMGKLGRIAVKESSENHSKETILVRRVVTDPSHPSQLYQLGVSGILLLLVLIVVRKKAKRTGTVFAAFLIGYGVSRIAMEFFRQPDPQRSGGLFELISLGQMLSLGVIAGGFLTLWLARRGRAAQSRDDQIDTEGKAEPAQDERTPSNGDVR